MLALAPMDWTSWSGSKLPCNNGDRALFRGCTKIQLGDGMRASFWHDGWCDLAPLHLWATDLYNVATRKKRSVATETTNSRWIRSIAWLNTPAAIAVLADLGHCCCPDSISWTLTSDGKYSASSAYHAQFMGSHTRFLAQTANAEPECKLFSWPALHGKLLIADMLAIRAGHTRPSVTFVFRRLRPPSTFA
jgi:hypothetical protein